MLYCLFGANDQLLALERWSIHVMTSTCSHWHSWYNSMLTLALSCATALPYKTCSDLKHVKTTDPKNWSFSSECDENIPSSVWPASLDFFSHSLLGNVIFQVTESQWRQLIVALVVNPQTVTFMLEPKSITIQWCLGIMLRMWCTWCTHGVNVLISSVILKNENEHKQHSSLSGTPSSMFIFGYSLIL